MEQNQNSNKYVMSKEEKVRFWALWFIGVFSLLVLVTSMTMHLVLHCS